MNVKSYALVLNWLSCNFVYSKAKFLEMRSHDDSARVRKRPAIQRPNLSFGPEL